MKKIVYTFAFAAILMAAPVLGMKSARKGEDIPDVNHIPDPPLLHQRLIDDAIKMGQLQGFAQLGALKAMRDNQGSFFDQYKQGLKKAAVATLAHDTVQGGLVAASVVASSAYEWWYAEEIAAQQRTQLLKAQENRVKKEHSIATLKQIDTAQRLSEPLKTITQLTAHIDPKTQDKNELQLLQRKKQLEEKYFTLVEDAFEGAENEIGLVQEELASQAMQLQQLQFAEMAIKVSKKLKDDGLTTKEREEALVRLFNKRAHAQS